MAANQPLFITAIDTDAGKTLTSAIFVQALKADYWKPIQAGLPRDTDTVKALVSTLVNYHPSAYELQMPASPHAAAAVEDITIQTTQIKLPTTQKTLIIEGAGGLLVPLNDHEVVIDLASQFEAEVVLVASLYLGSINHTLLSVQELQRRQLPVKGIVFNGTPNPASEQIILQKSRYKKLLHILPEKEVNPTIVKKYAAQLLPNL
ncbi:MAG: dethiobiotin synthase [Thermonemataceae bacterium]